MGDAACRATGSRSVRPASARTQSGMSVSSSMALRLITGLRIAVARKPRVLRRQVRRQEAAVRPAAHEQPLPRGRSRAASAVVVVVRGQVPEPPQHADDVGDVARADVPRQLLDAALPEAEGPAVIHAEEVEAEQQEEERHVRVRVGVGRVRPAVQEDNGRRRWAAAAGHPTGPAVHEHLRAVVLREAAHLRAEAVQKPPRPVPSSDARVHVLRREQLHHLRRGGVAAAAAAAAAACSSRGGGHADGADGRQGDRGAAASKEHAVQHVEDAPRAAAAAAPPGREEAWQRLSWRSQRHLVDDGSAAADGTDVGHRRRHVQVRVAAEGEEAGKRVADDVSARRGDDRQRGPTADKAHARHAQRRAVQRCVLCVQHDELAHARAQPHRGDAARSVQHLRGLVALRTARRLRPRLPLLLRQSKRVEGGGPRVVEDEPRPQRRVRPRHERN
eukprot:Rhum_TRINITY_DN10554_c0_g2::Rhum_TRINITY_DN10554_c0_g2_i1::g.38995::m.38995